MWGGKFVATLSIGMVMMMGCATSSSREAGREVDAGAADVNRVTPSLRAGIPCPAACSTPTPCSGTGAYAGCNGTSACGPTTFGGSECVAYCNYAPRAQAEVCDGLDNNCNRLVDENPAVLCDDGFACSSDSCQGSLGCANSAGLSTCQEIRRPVAESRYAADGYTWLMRRDNPRLVGRVFSRVASQTGTPGGYTRTMSPSAATIISWGTNNIEPQSPSPGWLWSENAAMAAGAVGNFRAPRVELPASGRIDVGLLRYPAASGATWEEVDWHYMELAPEVLLVPVRVTVFTNGANTWSQALVRQILDPAEVQTVSGTVSGSPVVANAISTETPAGVSPDSIWTQCNIQFRMVDYVEVPNATLATTLTNTCDCASNGIVSASRPIRPYITGAPANVVNVFIGGTISGPFPCPSGSINGLACGGSNALGRCSWNAAPVETITRTTAGANDFILIDRSLPVAQTREMTLAHEFGHILGLTHSPNGGLEQCLSRSNGEGDTAGASNLLMFPGSGTGTPNITPLQCARARCTTARWLERFNPSMAATTRRESVCAE